VDIEDAHIGRRVREVRTWRQMSLTATAGLAGISTGYLSLIERGLKPITKRSLLESLAHALQVTPSELTGKPYAPSDPASSDSHAAMALLADTLMAWHVGEQADTPPRPWGAVEAEARYLTGVLRPQSDYAAQAELLPRLIVDLLSFVDHPDRRVNALTELIFAYHASGNVAQRLGFGGLPALAVERMRQAAEALADPVWLAFTGWARAHVLSGTNRVRQYDLATKVADDQKARIEVRGMANLTAALASSALGNEQDAATHLDEASTLARKIDPETSPWGHGSLNFGRTNVGIWRVAVGVELGELGKVSAAAKAIYPESITRSRQCAFWIDYGRALVAERKTRDEGVAALLRADEIAPQQARSNAFMRETVADLLGSARRDAGGRELRGLAWRLGIAPKG
jgi:transcriptional regulator with XRE-family HTH domain